MLVGHGVDASMQAHARLQFVRPVGVYASFTKIGEYSACEQALVLDFFNAPKITGFLSERAVR